MIISLLCVFEKKRAEKIWKMAEGATAHGLSGKIFLSFVVEKDGSLSDVKIIRDLGAIGRF